MINPRRVLVLMITVLSVIISFGQVVSAAPCHPAGAGPDYRNPVSASFADTFADPSVIQAKDGWWYAYSTADPLRAGDKPGIMHIARTKDWVHWQYRGTVFDNTNRPVYATDTAGLWAPDIRYLDGRYVLYYAVTDTTLHAASNDAAIGVATAPRPDGPWTPTDAPIIAPRLRPGTSDYLGTIDPAAFTDVNGQHYLYFGGYNGGFWGTRLSADGLHAGVDYTMVAIDNRYEGGYVIRHGGWYYFMASTANCCAGPTTGYSVYSGRSRSPLGPFVDADGQSLLDPYVGGTNVIIQNGNRWIGPGHNAVATDAAGRDWLVYHAIDRHRPWLTEPFGINRRPMLIDPIDWIDGWPRVRAGAGPSAGTEAAPVTGSGLGITADDPAAAGVRGLTAGPQDPQAGATALLDGPARTVRNAPARSVRVRFDLKPADPAIGGPATAHPLTVRLGRRIGATVTVDRAGRRLTVHSTGAGGRGTVRSTGLPAPTDGWTTAIIEVTPTRVRAALSDSDLNDPYAEVRVDRSGAALPAAPVRFAGTATLLDNLTVRRVSRQATAPAPVPKATGLISSENFDNAGLPGWTWVRRDDRATVADGRLSWPVESAELVGSGNDAGVLLHDAPSARNWIVETKFTLDLGTDEVRNYQQAGLVAYRNDDDFARLTKVAIWNTRQVEFGREIVATADGRTSYGGSIQARPGRTDTWLRLAHHRNAAGEDEFRAAVSRDGRNWTWGAVWTFEPGSLPRIGLVAHGGGSPAVDADFDYVRFYRASWPRRR